MGGKSRKGRVLGAQGLMLLVHSFHFEEIDEHFARERIPPQFISGTSDSPARQNSRCFGTIECSDKIHDKQPRTDS